MKHTASSDLCDIVIAIVFQCFCLYTVKIFSKISYNNNKAEQMFDNCRSEALPTRRNRRRWNLEQARMPEAESASQGWTERQTAAIQGQDEAGLPPLSAALQGQDEEGLVPLSVVMDACLAQGILEQYRCASKACLG